MGYSREIFASVASQYPEFVTEWNALNRRQLLTLQYGLAGDKKDSGDESSEEVPKPVKIETRSLPENAPKLQPKPKPKLHPVPKHLLNMSFVKRYIQNPLFGVRDSYGKMT